MKTSKTMSKVLMLALAVMLVFAMAIPAAAQDYFTATSGSYIQGTAPQYSTTIQVNLVLESRRISGNYLYKTISNVALTPSGTQSFYVKNVLLAVQGNANNNLTFNDSSGNPIDANDDYVYSITGTIPNPDLTYAPTSPTAWNGWMFLINGQFPLISAGTGASISSAYVTNGDTIHFYHDDGRQGASGAEYAKITSVSNSGNSLAVNVKSSFQYFESQYPYDWVIRNFTNYQGVKVEVRNANGVFKSDGYTDASGNVTLSIENLGTPTCKVQVERRFLSTYDYQNGLIRNTADEVVYTPQ